MQKTNDLALTIDSAIFDALKYDFNEILQNTLLNMQLKETDQGELTVKLKIQLREEQIPDLSVTAYKAERTVIKPLFTHKVSSVMQAKYEQSGASGGEYELIWDEKSGDYVLRAINKNQISLFDDNKDYEEPEEAFDTEEAEETE